MNIKMSDDDDITLLEEYIEFQETLPDDSEYYNIKLDLFQNILEDIKSYTDFQILPIAQHLDIKDIERFFDFIEVNYSR